MNNLPRRIHRERTKGWRLPPDTICVSRPSKWGNPFWHAQRYYGLELAIQLYEDMARGFWNPDLVKNMANPTIVYEDHQAWLRRIGWHPVEVIRFELRGANLACWCPLTQPCHADVLLEIANA